MKLTKKFSGLRELGEALRVMRGPEAIKVARSMVNAGAQVVKRRAVANRRRDQAAKPYRVAGRLIQPGNIAKNIRVQRENRTPLTAEYIVTVRHKGKKVDGEPYRAGVFAEFGTVRQRPKPWLRPAFDNSKDDAVVAMKIKGEKRIEDLANKAKKK